MKKVHTRSKRKKGLSTRFRHTARLRGTARKKRLKTFATLQEAETFMKEHGYETNAYQALPAKKGKRFAIKKKV